MQVKRIDKWLNAKELSDGLTKKNIVRGKYRFLTEKEVSILKRL